MQKQQLKLLHTTSIQTFKSNLKLRYDILKDGNYYQNLNEVLLKKYGKLYNSYAKVMGIQECKEAEQSVKYLKDKYVDAQDCKDKAERLLDDVRRSSSDIEEQINCTDMFIHSEKFVNLLSKKAELSQNERNLLITWNECDRNKREAHTAYINAKDDFFDKEMAKRRNIKLLKSILAITGSIGSCIIVSKSLTKSDLEPVQKQLRDVQNLSEGSNKSLIEMKTSLQCIMDTLENTNEKQGWTEYFGSYYSSIGSSISSSKDFVVYYLNPPAQEVVKQSKRSYNGVIWTSKYLWSKITSRVSSK